MRKKRVVCMIACLTILLTGCNGNTAKETARNDTDKRISSTAGNTETTTETEKADDTTSLQSKLRILVCALAQRQEASAHGAPMVVCRSATRTSGLHSAVAISKVMVAPRIATSRSDSCIGRAA